MRVGCRRGGDYFGLTALPSGRFRVLWPETLEDIPQLRTAIISFEANPN